MPSSKTTTSRKESFLLRLHLWKQVCVLLACLCFAGRQSVLVIRIIAGTTLKFRKQENGRPHCIVQDHSVNATQDRVETTLCFTSTGNATSTVEPVARIQVDVDSSREVCQQNKTCVFRAYLMKSNPMGALLHWDNVSGVYSTRFPIYEGGITVGLMVVLEEYRNKSNTLGDHYDGFEIRKSVTADKPGMFDVAMGERIERPYANISIPNNTLLTHHNQYHNAEIYRQTLPLCRYTAQDMGRNHFDWVPRDWLLQRGFRSKDTLLIPEQNIHPTRNYTLYLDDYWKEKTSGANASASANTKPLTAYQKYAYFGRTCRQPWISPHDMEQFITTTSASSSSSSSSRLKNKGEQLHMVFLGTSRIDTIFNWMEYFLQPGYQDHWPWASRLKISNLSLQIKEMGSLRIQRGLSQRFSAQGICTSNDNNKNEKNENETLVFFVSFGIWQATYHGKEPHKKFRFDDTFEASLQYIQKRCGASGIQNNYKIVLMTQPSNQAFFGDELTDPSIPHKRSYQKLEGDRLYKQHYEVQRGGLMEVVNWSIRKSASKHNLTLVDLEAASLGRPDAASDWLHFFYPGTDSRSQEKIGNAVNVMFAQLALAGMFHAFDFRYDDYGNIITDG